jgi:hypothetical protein
MRPFDSRWQIGVYEVKKDEKTPPSPLIDLREVHSLDDIFSFLEPLKFGQMNFFVEIRLGRIIPPPPGDAHQPPEGDTPEGTRLSIVNFPVSSCTQLFVDFIYGYFQSTLLFPREPLIISLFRRQQNYSIEIVFAGYELGLSARLAGIGAQFCRTFQETRIGSVQEDLFS